MKKNDQCNKKISLNFAVVEGTISISKKVPQSRGVTL